jgi:hypothetical protein
LSLWSSFFTAFASEDFASNREANHRMCLCN